MPSRGLLCSPFLRSFFPGLCRPIHSKDTNLFQTMKKPAATKTQFALLPPVQRSRLKVQGSRFPGVSAILYPLSSIVLATALLCGCTGPRALKGGRALTARTPGGSVSQVLLQGENPSAASRQAQETVKVRTYTMPAGSRIEQPPFVAADL